MAPSVSLLYILFTVGFLSQYITSVPQLELGVHFLEEPKDVVGVKGKSLNLPCKFGRTNRHKDLVVVKWYHNDKFMNLTNDKRRRIFQNGTLHFSKLVHKGGGHSDQGEYRCVIVRENGSLSSRPGFLRVSMLPGNFSCHPLEQNVEVGSSARLSCEIDMPSELEIEWRKDDEKIPQDESKYFIISEPGVRGSILYIFNVVPDDSGSYRCTAKNILLNKQRHSSSGFLTVLPRIQENSLSHSYLTFLSAQQSVSSSFFANLREIKEGDNVTLDCVVNGSPTPALVWNFLPYGKNDSRPILNGTKTGYNILRIENITRHQAGWYTCSAMNSINKEVTTEVKVLTAPQIQEKSENIVFRASKIVRFRCVVSGDPVPQIFWLKDGALFNITGRIQHRTSVNELQQLRLSELILSSTVTSDAGIYQCMAKNSVDWTWAAIRLFLNATKPAPLAPEKVFCESLSSSEIKLTWGVPEIGDKIIGFSVHYHLTENGEEELEVLTPNSRSIHIDKLLPFTNYTFYVRLYIVHSASEFSEKAICQTGEEAPIETPKTKLKIISPNSVYVSWVPLPREKARGIINRYKIQWRIKGSPSSRVEEVTSDVLDYMITGLIPGKKYDVRVLAATSKGWPDSDLPWEALEIPLIYNEDLPSAPDVKLLAINSSSIQVKWSLPSRSKEILGYKIFYRKHNSNQLGPIIIPSEVKEYLLTGLDPETWYEVMIYGFTKSDDGETGVGSIHTLAKEASSQFAFDFSSILEPPDSLEAEPISPVAISLSWSLPRVASESNKISYYTVCFNSIKTSRNKNATKTCMKSSENKILIKGLNPYTLYEFKVKSHDINNKQSAFSQTVECHTLEDVPSSVIDISCKALNKTTIQVSWKEPRQRNGIIKNYTLWYTQDTKLPLNLWKLKVVSASNFATQLTDLVSNVKYYLLVRASTNAGFGSYGTPHQFTIPSLTGVSTNEIVPKASSDKQSDHYIGIMVGLGIGMCCIMLCTTCILCRRRCLKRHISQEFEVASSRHSNGNDCRRDRELVMESREPEFFTFLTSRRGRINSKEISVQHLDTKGHYPNGSANGVRMSLLNDGRASNDTEKTNNAENPKFDANSSNSPLLNSKTYCNSSSLFDSEPSENMKNRRSNSKSLGSGKRKFSELKAPVALNNNNFVPESNMKKNKTSLEKGNEETYIFSQNHETIVLHNGTDENETEMLNEDEHWLNLNSVLKNPDFRFSDSNSTEKILKRKNGFALPKHFYNTKIELSGFKEKKSTKENEDNRIHQINGLKLSLQVLSKEITQES